MKKAYHILVLLIVLLLAACTTSQSATTQNISTPAGRIYTANEAVDSVSLVDIATNKVLLTFPTAGGPHHLMVSPDGKQLWVTTYRGNVVQAFDTITHKELAKIDTGGPSDDLVFNKAGTRVYVTLDKSNELVAIDTQTFKIVNRVPVGKVPHGVAISPDERWIYVTNTAEATVSIIDATRMQPAGTVRVGQNPYEVIFSPDGLQAFVSNFLGDSVSVINPADATRAFRTLRVCKSPSMLEVSQDGTRLYTACSGSNEISVVDTATLQEISRIPAGNRAHGVVLGKDGKTLYVTNQGESSLWMIQIDGSVQPVTVAVGNNASVSANPNGIAYRPQ